MTPEARIAALEAENAALREQVETLAAQLQALQARLAKDSHNSGKPPSSDRLGRKAAKTKSLRKKSGKKPGGQLGHRGETLHLVATPDVVVEHVPPTCRHCHMSLEGAAVVLRERRQVHELPPLRLSATEHQVLHVRCPACQVLDDLTIPFDNNQAERDLRMLKVQQKVSGCFRACSGSAAFARIRGYLSTLSKQGHALLSVLETIFADQPLYPEFAYVCLT